MHNLQNFRQKFSAGNEFDFYNEYYFVLFFLLKLLSVGQETVINVF